MADESNTVNRDVERSTFTGSDDKAKSVNVREDIGETESLAATLANTGNVGATLAQMLIAQTIRHNEELFDRRIRREDELSVIRQRQLSNAADHDQALREATMSHTKSRNSQDVKHSDLAADRQWNVDEQGYQVAKIVEALGVDNRVAYAAMLQALAGLSQK